MTLIQFDLQNGGTVSIAALNEEYENRKVFAVPSLRLELIEKGAKFGFYKVDEMIEASIKEGTWILKVNRIDA